MKRRFYIFSLLLFAFAGATHAQSNKLEDIILKKVTALPEVESFMVAAKASKPLVMIAREPDKDFKYYWVKAGISNFDMFRTSYDFYVDPKTFSIFYLDMMVDQSPQVIPLKFRRRWYHTKGYNEMHTYKNGTLVVSKSTKKRPP
jgi:hypothetical protein